MSVPMPAVNKAVEGSSPTKSGTSTVARKPRNKNCTPTTHVSYTHLDVYKRQAFIERMVELALRYLAPDALTAVVVGPGR